MMARIVLRVVVFETERANRRHLGDVFAGFGPMKMPGLAGQNDHTARRIGLYLVAVKSLPEPNVKDARHDRVDAIFRMLVRHQFRAVGHLDPNHVRPGFAGMPDQDGKTSPRRERRKRLPVDIFGQDRTEYRLIRLMNASHGGFLSDISLVRSHRISFHEASLASCQPQTGTIPNRPCLTDLDSKQVERYVDIALRRLRIRTELLGLIDRRRDNAPIETRQADIETRTKAVFAVD